MHANLMLIAYSQREFESILQSRNAVIKLNELENLVSDAARRKSENPDREPPVP